MINLVKNELFKVFRKKSLYILGCITLVMCAINFFVIKSMNNYQFDADESYFEMLEKEISSYDLSDPYELGWYIADKITLEEYKITKEYDKDSWQYHILSNEIVQPITCMVNAEIGKNDEEYNSCKQNLDEIISEVNNNDWKYFVLKDKAVNEEELIALKAELSLATGRSAYEIQKQIDVAELVQKGYEYRLKNNIPYGTSHESSLIDDYVNYGTEYLNFNEDDSSYNFGTLSSKYAAESSYKVAEYKLENGIDFSYNSAAGYVVMDSESIIIFILIAVLMIAGSIVSDEFNKGTIKQLLLRPYPRWKILFSKYIATIIVFLLFSVFYYIVSTITYGLAMGFDSLLNPIVIYDFNVHAVREISLFGYWLSYFVAWIPYYLVFLTFAFMLGVLSTNSAVSIAGTFGAYIGIDIVNMFAEQIKHKLMQFMPTMCFDLTPYLFGNIGDYQYCKFWSSLLVTIVCIVLMYFIAHVVFMKKDIKNQ